LQRRDHTSISAPPPPDSAPAQHPN
jgi:hypothetical protein